MALVLRIIFWLCVALTASLVVARVMHALTVMIVRWCHRMWPTVPGDWRDEYAPKCKRCGYDLRESLDCCPECGKEMNGYDRAVAWQLQRLRNFDSPMQRLNARALDHHGEIAVMNRMRR